MVSLEYFPKEIERSVDFSHNKLKNLKYCATDIKGFCNFSHNELISLEGGPKTVLGSMNVEKNSLTSLKYCPEEIFASFDFSDNLIEKHLYTPKIVGGIIILNKEQYINSAEFQKIVELECILFEREQLLLNISTVLLANNRKHKI